MGREILEIGAWGVLERIRFFSMGDRTETHTLQVSQEGGKGSCRSNKSYLCRTHCPMVVVNLSCQIDGI